MSEPSTSRSVRQLVFLVHCAAFNILLWSNLVVYDTTICSTYSVWRSAADFEHPCKDRGAITINETHPACIAHSMLLCPWALELQPLNPNSTFLTPFMIITHVLRCHSIWSWKQHSLLDWGQARQRASKAKEMWNYTLKFELGWSSFQVQHPFLSFSYPLSL